MAWFGREKPDPAKDPKRKEEEFKQSAAYQRYIESFDKRLEEFLPGANALGKTAELENASVQDKDAFIEALLQKFQEQEGTPFIARKPQTSEVRAETLSAHDAVKAAIGFLRRSDKYLTATREEEGAYFEAVRKKRQRQEYGGPSYEEAMQELYGYLTQRLDKKQHALPILEKLITPTILGKIQPVILARLLGPGIRVWEANEEEACRKLKAELIRQLYLDGYTL